MEEQCLSNIMVIDLEVIAKLMLILNYKSFFFIFVSLYHFIIEISNRTGIWYGSFYEMQSNSEHCS